MPPVPIPQRQNLIVASLPESDRRAIVRFMEPVDLPVKEPIAKSGQTSPIYFLTSGLASIVTTMASGGAVEGGAVGHEGWIGADMFGGAMPAGSSAFQQIAGAALRMTAQRFAEAQIESHFFATAVGRFRGVLLSHAMQGAACNRLHDATSRCARWIVFTAERVESTDVHVTHEFLAQMLGGSRSAVTATLTTLERRRLIERRRGHIVVRNEEGLRRAACECERVLSELYGRYEKSLRA